MATVFEFMNWFFLVAGVAVVLAGWVITLIVDRFLTGNPRAGRTFKWGFGAGVTLLGIAMAPMGVLVSSSYSEFIPWVFGFGMIGAFVAIGATLYALSSELFGELTVEM